MALQITEFKHCGHLMKQYGERRSEVGSLQSLILSCGECGMNKLTVVLAFREVFHQEAELRLLRVTNLHRQTEQCLLAYHSLNHE